MRCEMAKLDAQRIEGSQHVLGVLLHGVVGVVVTRRRPVAFATAAPVDPDNAQAAWKQRCSELDPILAGKVAMDEDDGDVASSPLLPTQLNAARLHLWHSPSLFVQAGGGRCAGRR